MLALKIREWEGIQVTHYNIIFYREILEGLEKFIVDDIGVQITLALLRYFMESGEIRIVDWSKQRVIFQVVKP